MPDWSATFLSPLFTDAYRPFEVLVELFLIGLAVHWSASVLQGTRGTRPLRTLLVLLIVATLVVRILAVRLDWARLELLYRYFVFAVGFIGLVAFQPELRRAMFRIGEIGGFRQRKPQSKVINTLVKSAGYLSKNRYGALIAIERKANLQGHAENGTMMNAELSSNLLNSIFFPNSPLHDLGVIIRGNRIVAANVQFPLAEGDEIDAALGSRHLAATAMSYETGALVLVVSEESGTISICDDGELIRYLSLDDLAAELTKRLADTGERLAGGGRGFAHHAWRFARHALLVVAMTGTIWYLADQATQTQIEGVKIELRLDPPGGAYAAEVQRPQPAIFSATLRGSTRAINVVRNNADDIPRRVTIVLPEELRPGEYSASARELLERVPELRNEGLHVAAVTPPTLQYVVHELVGVVLPLVPSATDATLADWSVTPATAQALLKKSDLDAIPPDERVVRVPLNGRIAGLATDQPHELERVVIPNAVGRFSADVTPDEAKVRFRIVGTRTQKRLKGVAVQLLVSPPIYDRYVLVREDNNEFLIELEVEGDRTAVDALQPGDVRASVRIDEKLEPPSDEFRQLEVQINLPPNVTLVGAKPTVRVRLAPRVGTPQ